VSRDAEVADSPPVLSWGHLKQHSSCTFSDAH